jgi:hypothetical protein
MSGDWIKMRSGLAADPAVIRIRRTCGLDVDAVVGKLHRLWSWADAHTVDGTADGLDLDWVDETAGAAGFGACMIAAGWLEETPRGVRFANFGRHNGQSAKVRALAQTRMKRTRCADSATESEQKANTSATREEKRREEKKREELNTPAAPVAASVLAKRPKRSQPAGGISWTADAGWQGITDGDRAEWLQAYPACDLQGELAKSGSWLRANPTKAHKSNWRRFLVAWLTRSQDHGGTHRTPGVRPPDRPPAKAWSGEFREAAYRRPKESAALAERARLRQEDSG